VVERLVAGPLRGRLFNARGHARPASLRDSSQLFLMLLAADLNPYVQAGLPGAIAAARRGDYATLLRLRRLADGTPSRVRDLSAGLNAVTVCADTPLPYALTTPVAERPGLIAGALDAIAPELFAPFDRQALLAPSIADDCSLYPEGEAAPAPSEAPLPDVPALLLNGRLDWRTPFENADAVATQLPRAQRVYVPGTGHDVLDSDYTGCAERALSRFIGGRRMGRPCRGKTNAQLPYPVPAASLAAVAPAPGIPGRRGRVVAAVLDTVRDARIAATQALWAGYRRLRGGGLRGGSFSGTLDAQRLRLGGYKYVEEVRVSGSLRAAGNGYRGRLRVEGPANLDGFLQIDQHNRATGRIGGRAVSYRGGRATASAAATPGSWSPADGLPLIPSREARRPRP
jgi:pimeloyl-ACP methyl ester carboxylesterase